MRDSPYATLLCEVRLNLGNGHEARAERLKIKESGEEEIRFSWWQNDRIMPRPLDLPENEWIELFERAVKAGVFSEGFRKSLIRVLSEGW